jgi:hypothetical protein
MDLDKWLTKDVYWQEAVYQAVSSVIEARNKKEKDSLMKQISGSQESALYVSPFATVPKPTFQMG